MTPMFRENPNLSMHLVRSLPDRTAKAAAWTVMVIVCVAAHVEFMRLISPFTALIGF